MPHVATAAVENALVEGLARRNGVSVAEHLGGAWRPAVETNQCLFWSPDETFERLAVRFLGERFRQIKVRIAVGSFETDLTRLARLRELAGPEISIAVDANGAWSADDAIPRLRALERFNLSYVEQPTMPGDWTAFNKALASTSLPLMVDEGLADEADVDDSVPDRPARSGASQDRQARWAAGRGAGDAAVHRCRCGCHDRADERGRHGDRDDGPVRNGAAAALCRVYGCYGLLDDVTSGVTYSDGRFVLPPGPGLGVTFDAARCRTVWTQEFG